MEILNTGSNINFKFKSGLDRMIPKTTIGSVDVVADEDKIVVSLGQESNAGASSVIYIPYDKVTEPVTTSILQLRDIITEYSASQDVKQVFSATNGQTDFVVTGFTLNDSYLVFIDGALQIPGHTRSGNTVVFSVSPFTGGEEVVVII